MKHEDVCAVYVRVKGRVQGVGFRYFTLAAANQYGVKGWVRNLSDGDVECEAQGPRLDLENFVEALRKGPSLSRVEDLHVLWKEPVAYFTEFSMR